MVWSEFNPTALKADLQGFKVFRHGLATVDILSDRRPGVACPTVGLGDWEPEYHYGGRLGVAAEKEAEPGHSVTGRRRQD
jgi:hypothetical protein